MANCDENNLAAIAREIGINYKVLHNIKRSAEGKDETKRRLPFEELARWAIDRGVDFNYLLTGQSSPTHGDQDAEGVLQLRRKDDPQSIETKELLDLVRKVLKSDDDLAKKALTESIRALSRPVKDDNPIKKGARRRSA